MSNPWQQVVADTLCSSERVDSSYVGLVSNDLYSNQLPFPRELLVDCRDMISTEVRL